MHLPICLPTRIYQQNKGNAYQLLLSTYIIAVPVRLSYHINLNLVVSLSWSESIKQIQFSQEDQKKGIVICRGHSTQSYKTRFSHSCDELKRHHMIFDRWPPFGTLSKHCLITFWIIQISHPTEMILAWVLEYFLPLHFPETICLQIKTFFISSKIMW